MRHLSQPIEFPLGVEGLFYRLQLTLRVVAEDRANIGRRVFAALAISWLPLALLWWWQGAPGNVSDAEQPASLFQHLATYARFFVTIPLLIAAENAVQPYLGYAFEHAVTSDVVPPLVIAIVVPFLPVLAMVFPLQELLSGVVHVFLGRAE